MSLHIVCVGDTTITQCLVEYEGHMEIASCKSGVFSFQGPGNVPIHIILYPPVSSVPDWMEGAKHIPQPWDTEAVMKKNIIHILWWRRFFIWFVGLFK